MAANVLQVYEPILHINMCRVYISSSYIIVAHGRYVSYLCYYVYMYIIIISFKFLIYN